VEEERILSELPVSDKGFNESQLQQKHLWEVDLGHQNNNNNKNLCK
jgi:hypothetical protein